MSLRFWEKLAGGNASDAAGLASPSSAAAAGEVVIGTQVQVVRHKGAGIAAEAPNGGVQRAPAPIAPSLKLAVNNATPPALIEGTRHLDDGSQEITTLVQLRSAFPDWRSDFMDGVVTAEFAKSLKVLWLGLGDVALLGTAAALASTHSNTVRERLSGGLHLHILAERSAKAEILAELIETSQNSTFRSRRSAGLVVSPENYALVVYDEIFAAAVKAKASDIHIMADKEPADGAIIGLRQYGAYRKWRKHMSATLVRAMLGSAFGQRLGATSNSRGHLSFDNEIAFMTEQTVGTAKWMGRCNGRPAVDHYRMVIRLLESNPNVEDIPTLDGLGYVKSHRDMLGGANRRNHGLIFIFGATGSGKTTLLRTFITRMTDLETTVVYTVESPVEYKMPGVTQFPIPVDVSMTSEQMSVKFGGVLKDVMRMNPDRLMMGEVRDSESAKLMSEFAMSGHRCYTTSHGDSVVDGLARMCGETIKMPAELFGGARFLAASIYQRLVPKLCPQCRLPATDPVHGLPQEKLDLLRSKFKLDPGTMKVANPQGCSHCEAAIAGLPTNGTKGVTVVPEVLIPNQRMRRLMAARDWVGVMDVWRSSRTSGFGDGDMTGKTAFECALYLCSQGVISILDVEHDFEPLESYEIYATAAEAARGVAQ